MKIDCISDLHGFAPKLEGGDLLIVAGDLMARDELNQFTNFKDWLSKQKYKKMIVIAGNHDRLLEKRIGIGNQNSWDSQYLSYLEDSGTEFEYLKIWGSPWTQSFIGMNPKCKAFTVDTEEELEQKFSLIPDDIDILITHSPPFDILDETSRGEKVGSKSLLTKSLNIKPRLHVFGHIHEEGGKQLVFKRPGHGTENNTTFINASVVNEYYEHVNKPITINL